MTELTPLMILQKKCGVTADGIWGPQTYKAARKYFRLTNNQAAHFFGQCAHESGNFKVFSENLNYSAEGLLRIFSKYFPTIQAATPYANKPDRIANKVYGNRMGNGDEKTGDGYRFRGRGAIQLTGRNNYTLFSEYMRDPDILTNPGLVATEYAFDSALWFFRVNKLLPIADEDTSQSTIVIITKKVNGGTHGIDDRISKTQRYATWL